MAAWEEQVLQTLNQLRQHPQDFTQAHPEAHQVVSDLTPVIRLHLSTGLCAAARDVACYLRTFGFIASHSQGEAPVCSPFIQRYGRLEKGPVLENFAYSFDSPTAAVTQILTSTTPDIHGPQANLRSPQVRVIGLAVASHTSEKVCLVLLFCGEYFDRVEIKQEPAPAVEAEFFPARLGKKIAETVIGM